MRKMFNHHFILPIIILAMTGFVLAGCSRNEEAGVSYKAGTYTGEGNGIHGLIKLSVSFSENAITGIDVIEQSESEGISDPAFQRIPGEIIEYQSLDIDTVSGCTYSSNGILEAVADAVEKAGGDPEVLKDVPVIKMQAGSTIEKTADVIIIGGGGAGMAAASSAADNGASVIVLEKTAALGGILWQVASP